MVLVYEYASRRGGNGQCSTRAFAVLQREGRALASICDIELMLVGDILGGDTLQSEALDYVIPLPNAIRGASLL